MSKPIEETSTVSQKRQTISKGMRFRSQVFDLLEDYARMAVPKMVKNGFNSVLRVSAVFQEDRYPRKSRREMKREDASKIMERE